MADTIQKITERKLNASEAFHLAHKLLSVKPSQSKTPPQLMSSSALTSNPNAANHAKDNITSIGHVVNDPENGISHINPSSIDMRL